MKESVKFSIAHKTFQTMKVVEQSMKNRCFFVGIILTSAVLFVIMLGFNALAGNPNLIEGDPFHHSIANISAMYPLKITPAGWAFSIWGLIYLLQMGSTLYSLGLLCRKTQSGQPAYRAPAVLSPLYFVLFSLSCCLNVGWLFLWDRLLFSASLVFLALNALVLFSAVSVASTRLTFYRAELIDAGRMCDVRIIRALVINGLAMYATWSTIATLINFGVAALYQWRLSLSNDMISTICLGILFCFVVLYFALDITTFDCYTRYTLTPYATVIWALSAVVAKNWNLAEDSSIAAAIILVVGSFLFIFKLIITMKRESLVSNPYRRLKIDGLVKLQDK